MKNEDRSSEEFLYLEPDELGEKDKTPEPRAGFIPFSLADEWYAVPIEEALEVVKLRGFTRVPGLPGFIMGVANIRGDIISIVDLKQLLSLESAPGEPETTIIIINAAKKTTGLLVDSVQNVLSIPVAAIQPALSTISPGNAEFIRGAIKPSGGRLITILDMEKIMSSPQMSFE